MYILRLNNQNRFWENKQLMITIFIMIAFLHMQFAGTGWFYRYEAYLVGLGIFIMTILQNECLPDKTKIKINNSLIAMYIAWALLFCLLIFPLIKRGLMALVEIPQAAKNIYEQQYQMGLFVRKFYQGKVLVLNDIGAVNYFADIKTLDLWGLGSMETAKLKVQKMFTAENIEGVVKEKGGSIAIIYDTWFVQQNKMLASWIKVGQWKILHNTVCGGDTVSFYAVDPSEKNNLIKNLKTFSFYLPKDVEQSGIYAEM